MSHTSAQSSHNPAPDTGPEPDAYIKQITEWMDTVTRTIEALHQRIRVLEGVNTFPMLSDLSTRLEALENIVVGSWDGEVTRLKDIDYFSPPVMEDDQ